jgi:hypothetical protein
MLQNLCVSASESDERRWDQKRVHENGSLRISVKTVTHGPTLQYRMNEIVGQKMREWKFARKRENGNHGNA